jgi:hypothetical protein
MPENGLIVIAPVCEGKEPSLLQTLNAFGNDVQGTNLPKAGGQPRIDFAESSSIHFARLALMDDPGRGPGRKRLLLTTDFDGSEDDHIREIMRLTKQPQAIWGCCEGYQGPDTFAQFIHAHTVTPEAFYIAFRGDALPRLRACVGLNEFFQLWLADPAGEKVLKAWPVISRVGNALHKLGHVLWFPFDVLFRAISSVLEVIGLMATLGPRNVFEAAKSINQTIDQEWWVRLLNFIFSNWPPPAGSPYSRANPKPPPNPIPAGYPPENAILQNQLTLVTEIKPESLARLRAVLALIDLYGRRLSTPGSLVGISTIHTVRWAIFDGGKRVMLASNYDGTWENYIDEFAEMILSGLNALWTSAPDFPVSGAQDVAALKQFLRLHQVPANAFYSAYPAASVLNLKDDLQFSFWFGWILRRLTADQKPGGHTASLTS